MPQLDAVQSMESLTDRILGEVERAMAQRRTAEAQDLLEILSEVLSGAPLLHTLSAHATSLELRTHRLRAWIEEERLRAAQANLASRGEKGT